MVKKEARNNWFSTFLWETVWKTAGLDEKPTRHRLWARITKFVNAEMERISIQMKVEPMDAPVIDPETDLPQGQWCQGTRPRVQGGLAPPGKGEKKGKKKKRGKTEREDDGNTGKNERDNNGEIWGKSVKILETFC